MPEQCGDCKEEVQPDARFCPHCGVRLERELKNYVRPPSRPPTTRRKHEPVVVTEEVPEAVRLLRERKKRGKFKTSKVVAQERLQEKQRRKSHTNFQIAIIVIVIIAAICKLLIREL